MGIYDRPYWKEEQRGGGGGFGAPMRGAIRPALPKPSRAVTVIMIACAAVFLLQIFSRDLRLFLTLQFGVRPSRFYEVWRFGTFQFLHGSAGHFVYNMLGLYFFGPPLERTWGTQRFVWFYLLAGAFGGLCYLAMAAATPLGDVPLIGASGGILACLAACAILYPQMIVLIFPIRWVAVFLAVLYVLGILHDRSYSDAAHLGGMVAAVAYLVLWPRVRTQAAQQRVAARKGAWQKKMQARAAEQKEVDRILQKIKDRGLESLSDKERQTLRDATRNQRKEENDLYKA